MSDFDWKAEQKRVLNRMQQVWGNLSDYQRQLGGIKFTDPDNGKPIYLSPAQAIREVSMLSELGKKIIVAEAKKLSELQI